MSQRFVTIWAIATTVIAIASLSYIAGKRAGGAQNIAPRSATQAPAATAPGVAREQRPAYVIPEQFDGMDNEWRTDADEATTGYAALFDPSTRQLIVEQCEHSGFAVDDTGNAIEPSYDYCSGVLNAQIDQLGDTTVLATNRAGREIKVRLEARLESEMPSLRLRFDDHDVTLVPGSRNDLIQQMEKSPIIAAQKEKFLLAQMRQLAGSRESVPSFALPEQDSSE